MWIKAGGILILPSILAMLPFVHSNRDTVGLVAVIIECIQLVVLFGTIAPVESALKKKILQEEGNWQ